MIMTRGMTATPPGGVLQSLWELWALPNFVFVTRHGSTVVERVLVNRTPQADNSSWPPTNVSLITSTASHPQKVLIDSGADASFMDKGLAWEFGLGSVPLERLVWATSLDGRPLWYISHRTTPVRVTFPMVTLNSSPSLNSPHTYNLRFWDLNGSRNTNLNLIGVIMGSAMSQTLLVTQTGESFHKNNAGSRILWVWIPWSF